MQDNQENRAQDLTRKKNKFFKSPKNMGANDTNDKQFAKKSSNKQTSNNTDNKNKNTQKPKNFKNPNKTKKDSVKATIKDNKAIKLVTTKNTAHTKPQKTKNKLKIYFLGGVGEIGKNMTAIEYGNDIIIVDAGLSFPNEEMLGVDLVIPDISYLSTRADNIRAVILTHGHEDHIGGLPYLLKEIKTDIYGTKLTLALADNKLREHRINDAKTISVECGDVISLGAFKVEFINVTHSISGAVALAITTPQGVIFHSGDYKIDLTPAQGNLTNLPRIAQIGSEGVLLMLAESTNVERSGYSMSESVVGDTLNTLFADHINRRLIIATFASNVHRLQQIIDLAEKYKRKIAFSGRSMLNVVEAASKIGELKVPKTAVIDIDKINNMHDRELVIISTGSQGEPMSALTRMASGEFNKVKIGENDTVIISASPIPGNEKMVYRVINNLYRKGAKVIYEALENIHVSGHACQEEIKLLHSLVKPKFFIPVHGEYRHLKRHAILAEEMGMPAQNILIAEIGNSVAIDANSMKFGDNFPAGSKLVDGLDTFDGGESVILRDRRHLAEDGLFVVVVGISSLSGEILSGPYIINKGFIPEEAITNDARNAVISALLKVDLKKDGDRNEANSAIRRALKNYIFKKVRKNPMILPVIMEI